MNTRLHGLVAATHTPFHPDGSLAPEVVPVQAAYLASRGVGIVFITGSTGESHSLTRDERLAIFHAWAAAGPACGLRVVAHVGGNCLEDARHFAAAAADCGFEAIAALSPSYFKPARLEVLVDVCARIASAAPSLPFYYYDIPSMTQVRFDMLDFLTLAGARIPNLAGIKFTNDNLDAFSACLTHDDGRFDIPWGIDEKLVDSLAAGALGAVGSSYNFAAPLYQTLIAAFRAGDAGRARDLQHQSVELIEALYAVGYFGGAKALMTRLGVPVGPARCPLDNPTPAQLDDLWRKLDGCPWFGPPA
ncbi:MAG: dihydrodipicolinate synthase family protein [Verrucomicrobia bacterium]|nr:dihydrodipicolinate synthase family protein [Verrucomicrobiota bacterium]